MVGLEASSLLASSHRDERFFFFKYAQPGVKSTHQLYPAMSGVNSNNDRKEKSIGTIMAQASWE